MNGLKTAMGEDKTKLKAAFLQPSKNIVPESKNVFIQSIPSTMDQICAL